MHTMHVTALWRLFLETILSSRTQSTSCRCLIPSPSPKTRGQQYRTLSHLSLTVLSVKFTGDLMGKEISRTVWLVDPFLLLGLSYQGTRASTDPARIHEWVDVCVCLDCEAGASASAVSLAVWRTFVARSTFILISVVKWPVLHCETKMSANLEIPAVGVLTGITALMGIEQCTGTSLYMRPEECICASWLPKLSRQVTVSSTKEVLVLA